MADRYYCTNLAADDICLEGAEAHHAINVMRVRAGQTVRLFDGFGTIAEGTVQQVKRRDIGIAVTSRTFTPRQKHNRITVAAPAPKGERLRWMLEKLTELGVHCWIPLQTERTEKNYAVKKEDKLRTTIINACKQCQRAWLMEISAAQSLSNLLQSHEDCSLMLAHPDSQAPLVEKTDGESLVLIGPEGGFTEAEVELAISHHAQLVGWPDTILRTETAAVVFAAAAISGTVG